MYGEDVPSQSAFQFPASKPLAANISARLLVPIRFLSTAMPAGKDPIFRLAVLRTLPPLDRRLGDEGMDWYGFLRRFGLTGADESVHDGTCYFHCSRRDIDVAPFQSEKIAFA